MCKEVELIRALVSIKEDFFSDEQCLTETRDEFSDRVKSRILQRANIDTETFSEEVCTCP